MPLTHITRQGSIKMVDISAKRPTKRRAIVQGRVLMKLATLQAIIQERLKKGNVLETARLAGIITAKETHKIIPLCHPINITHIKIDFRFQQPKTIKNLKNLPSAVVEITTLVEGYDRTGFEMEAMVATSIAALTIYDMCKAIDRGMQITDIQLVEKAGGKSGHYKRS